MNSINIKMLKVVLSSVFLIIFLNACSTHKNVWGSNNYQSFVKGLSGSNNFSSLVEELVEKSERKLKRHVPSDEVVLVSDFVNLDKLKNRSQLGFLLSDHLKDSLLNKDIIVREVELGKDFQYGKHGFNLLTRKHDEINKKFVDVKLAFVGTYTITTRSFIVFLKLIDISNGNILSSSNLKTPIDEEILELEQENKQRRLVITPPLVL